MIGKQKTGRSAPFFFAYLQIPLDYGEDIVRINTSGFPPIFILGFTFLNVRNFDLVLVAHFQAIISNPPFIVNHSDRDIRTAFASSHSENLHLFSVDLHGHIFLVRERYVREEKSDILFGFFAYTVGKVGVSVVTGLTFTWTALTKAAAVLPAASAAA